MKNDFEYVELAGNVKHYYQLKENDKELFFVLILANQIYLICISSFNAELHVNNNNNNDCRKRTK